MESAQRTVTSLGAISTDTQDSARYDDAPFPCGNIHFWIGQMNMEESSVSVVGPEYSFSSIFLGMCNFHLFSNFHRLEEKLINQ